MRRSATHREHAQRHIRRQNDRQQRQRSRLKRGSALPLLFDLARKPVFLHDNSVPTLEALFDATRGANAPHPFYLEPVAARADLAAFLDSIDASTN
jgi:hypothetical protein